MNRADLEARIGERVTLTGHARNAAAGAILALDAFPVYVGGLQAWPQDVLERVVEVSGTIVARPGAPAGVHGPGDALELGDATWAAV
ncbi:hypothetical protein FSW04_10315 [Baekduia soli]|uniref:Uncharacterized protein n=1 Tax=Baekduia soli TaxID=496014 RepID=A0A5B8U4A9_9ACTN|nr:hypothetical protein [Baekduia soli]QEC47924.1 hypothetical protein FSW04_10315 [Baekduia soli]